MRFIQVAFIDTYRAYKATPGTVEALRSLVETSIDRQSEIEPYVEELGAYEVTGGDRLYSITHKED